MIIMMIISYVATVGSLYYVELKLCEVVYQHIVLFYLCDIITTHLSPLDPHQ